jgi:hypothetical protein
MRRRIVLSAVLASLLALPVTAHAQSDPTSDAREILEQLARAAGARVAEIDLRAAVDEVIGAAQDVDLDSAVDAAIAAASEVDVEGVVAEAQQWVQENADVVCAGSGLSAGAAAAAVVAYVTGSPGLAIRAFEETERLGSDACTRVAAPSAAEASPDQG